MKKEDVTTLACNFSGVLVIGGRRGGVVNLAINTRGTIVDPWRLPSKPAD